jgi:hypothetical protein
MFNVENLISEQKTRIRDKNMDQMNIDPQLFKSITNGNFHLFSIAALAFTLF